MFCSDRELESRLVFQVSFSGEKTVATSSTRSVNVLNVAGGVRARNIVVAGRGACSGNAWPVGRWKSMEQRIEPGRAL